MILDFENYADYHPGGTFLLTQTLGRDISKFFYGGFSMQKSKTGGYSHSNLARKIVN